MANKLQIWNLALTRMGQSRQLIDVESMSTPEHRNLATLYEPTMLSMLEDHSWNFAKRLIKLTKATADFQHPSWAYCYDYPENCLDIRILTPTAVAGNDEESDGYLTGASSVFGAPLKQIRTIPFEVVSLDEMTKLICTNLNEAWAEYIISDVNESMFPPMFVTAFSYRLGAELALALAGDLVKHQELMKYYSALFERSKERVANESHRVLGPTVSKYEGARR